MAYIHNENTPTMVKLISEDNMEIVVERAVAERSDLLRNIIANMTAEEIANEAIPLPLIMGFTLQYVFAWCSHHQNDPIIKTEEQTETEVDQWEQQYWGVMDQYLLADVTVAAVFLNIQPLLDLANKAVPGMILPSY